MKFTKIIFHNTLHIIKDENNHDYIVYCGINLSERIVTLPHDLRTFKNKGFKICKNCSRVKGIYDFWKKNN